MATLGATNSTKELTEMVQDPVSATWKCKFEEFYLGGGGRPYGTLGLYNATSGTGSATTSFALTASEQNREGIYQVTSGSTAGAYAGFFTHASGIRFGGGEHRIGMAVKLQNVPDATNNFVSIFGCNTNLNSFGTYVCAIVVDRSVSTTNFVSRTTKASITTTTNTGVALDTNWHNMEILVNADNTSVGFYIDGTLVSTHTTNLPNASLYLQNVQYRVAGAARTHLIDWMYKAFKPTGGRGSIHTWIG